MMVLIAAEAADDTAVAEWLAEQLDNQKKT